MGNLSLIETETISLTVNRWHKVEERLRKKAGEIREKINSGYREKEITTYIGVNQLVKFKDEKKNVNKYIDIYYSILKTIEDIRIAIADFNSKEGINLRLTQAKIIEVKIEMLKEIISKSGINNQNSIYVEEVSAIEQKYNDIKNKPSESGFMRGSSQSIAIRVLNEEEINMYEDEIENLNKKHFFIMDEIAEKNGKKIRIEIEKIVADYIN